MSPFDIGKNGTGYSRKEDTGMVGRSFRAEWTAALTSALMTVFSASGAAELPEIAPMKAWRGVSAVQEKVFPAELGADSIRFD